MKRFLFISSLALIISSNAMAIPAGQPADRNSSNAPLITVQAMTDDEKREMAANCRRLGNERDNIVLELSNTKAELKQAGDPNDPMMLGQIKEIERDLGIMDLEMNTARC